jgi:hypothetical protein
MLQVRILTPNFESTLSAIYSTDNELAAWPNSVRTKVVQKLANGPVNY